MTYPVHKSARAVSLLLVALGCVALVGCTGGTSLGSLLGGNTLGDLLGTLTDNQSASQTPSGQDTGNQTGGTGDGTAGDGQGAGNANGGAADAANDGDADDTGGIDTGGTANDGTGNGGTGNGGAGGQVSIIGEWDVMFTAVAIASEDAGINEGDQRPGSWTFTENADGTVKMTSGDGGVIDGSWTGSSYYFEEQAPTVNTGYGQGYTIYKIECFLRDSTSMYGTMEMDYVFDNYTGGLIPQGHDAYSFEATRRG